MLEAPQPVSVDSTFALAPAMYAVLTMAFSEQDRDGADQGDRGPG